MLPPRDVYSFVVVFIFQKLLEPFNCPRMQSACPALGLSDLGARLFEGLVLKVVALKQFSLFFRELLDGGTHPASHLLELNALVCGEHIVRHLHRVGAVEARAEHHRETRDGAGDALDLVFEATAAALAIGQVAEIGVRALASCGAPFQDAHLPQAVVDGALDAVMREGQEVRPDSSVKALRRFEQANLAPRDQLIHLELGVELLAHLGRERPYIGAVFLQDLRL